MIQEDQVTEERARPETSRGHYLLEVFGILSFVLLILLIGVEIYGGMINFGDLWLVPILAVLAYLAADFLSGFVHFLADNFGSYDTPILGPNFIQPFREHHIDPKGIVGNDFVDANGNNSLASLPFMLVVWVVVPLETWYYGYLFGTVFLFVCLAAFLTNQFHKWAHMDTPPAFVGWLQERGVILSREHTTTSTTRAPTTPTTASRRGSGTRCLTASASTSGRSALSGAPSQAPTPGSGRRGKET